MADFRLGRLKFNWRGAWAPSTAYVIDDIISFKGNTYVCVVNHTSASSETIWETTDLSIATPRWQLHVPGIRIMGAWAPNTFYAKNDLISYGANQYLCVVNHTSSADQNLFYSNDLPSWSLYTEGTAYKTEWQPGTWYKLNDIVKYGNTLYLTIVGHTSGIQFDPSKFTIYLESLKFEDTWVSSTEYQPGDIVNFGGYTYISKTINTGKQPNIYSENIVVGGVITTPADWDIVTTGFDMKGQYDNNTIYVPGDVVQFGGNTYVKISTGAAGVYPIDTNAWKAVSTGLNWRGPWSDSATYQVNDVVSKQSASWVNLTPHNTNIDPVEDQTVATSVKTWTVSGGTTLAGEAGNTYTAVASTTSGGGANATFTVVRDGSGAISSITAVDKGTGYANGDTVTIAGASIGGSTPTDNVVLTLTAVGTGTGGLNWQAVAQGESTLTLQDPGDILYRNAAGANVNLPIGTQGEILTVDENGLPAWERNNNCANVFYVTTDGVDDPDYGKNISKPWRTIRYALAQTAGLGAKESIVTIFVKSGTYEEQLPLVTSPWTSIVGDNLRATIIKPTRTGLSAPTSSSITGISYDETAKENRYSTMWYLTESVTLKDLVMTGMEGFVPAGGNNSWDITQADWQNSGVFLRLRADIPITGKSPYITQCSAFSGRTAAESLGDSRYNGGIGAIIDKSIYGQTTSNGSMLFDSFTQFHDGGIGFWCKDLGNAEVVSCFTYYCHIGYTCTGGGRIRSLAGNNSYGVYGCVSKGTDATETPLTATVRGLRLNHAYNENSPKFVQGGFVIQGSPNGVSTVTFTGGGTGTADAVYNGVASTSGGTGSGATFDVTRANDGTVSTVTVAYAGSDYGASEEITIAGNLIGGTTPTDDLTLTVTARESNFSTDNPNYALALILYKQDAGVVDGEDVGEDYLLIEPVTGTFGDAKPIAAADGAGNLLVGSSIAVRALTKTPNALSGIYGKVFTLTDLPVVNGQADIPRKTASVEFLDVTGSPQYTDDNFYTINGVSDDTTAQSLTVSVTRKFDTPGTAANSVVITQIKRETIDENGVVQGQPGFISAFESLVTVTTATSHNLTVGDEVNVVISIASLQTLNTPAFERTSVHQYVSANVFTYKQSLLAAIPLETLPVAGEASRVFKVFNSGGSTPATHNGGAGITLYNLSSSTILLDNQGSNEINSTLTGIPISSSTWTNQFSTAAIDAGNAFLLINNELMRISTGQTFPNATINVTRGVEGTTNVSHTDGSVVYYVVKQSNATTLSGDVSTTNGSGSEEQYDLPVFSLAGIDQHDILKIDDEFFRVTSPNTVLVGRATVTFSAPKEQKLYNGDNWGAFTGQGLEMRLRYSQVRLTGHDFLLIGVGDKAATNWPNTPSVLPEPDNEVYESYPGRVYYTSTDQDGNFRVGNLFEVEQATGSATLNANAFKLSGLSSLRLGTIGAQLGAEINEFSTDINLGGEFSRDSACPTQLAVKTYVDNNVGSGILRVAPTFSADTLGAVGTVATFKSFVKNNVYPQDEIIISGANESGYNGRFVVNSIDTETNSFTFTVPGGTPGTASGAIVCERIQKVDSELKVDGPLNLVDTWNAGGTDLNAINVAITDTASGSASNLLNMTVGTGANSTKFKVDKSGNTTIAGSLTVAGTTTTVNSTNLSIADATIVVGNGATDSTSADGAGFQFGAAENTGNDIGLSFKWDHTNTRYALAGGGLDIAGSLTINGNAAISASGLGSAITSSSLTSLGVLSGLSVQGISKIRSVKEEISYRSASQSGPQTYDFATAAAFYHPGLGGNVTVSIINVPEDNNSSMVINLIIAQGATPYVIANTVGISANNTAGPSYTIKWRGGSAPTGSANEVNIITLTCLRTYDGSTATWNVYGELSAFA